MFKFKDRGLTPTTGWVYSVPELSYEVKADSFEALVEKVRKLLQINNRDVPENLAEIIEDALCRKNPSGFCHGFLNRMAFTARTLMNGTNAFAALLRQGKGGLVDPDTADGRALICSQCELNVKNPGCYTCKSFESIIRSVTRGRKTQIDDKLNVCGICGCFIRAMVHCDKGVLKASTPKKDVQKYPDHCWKRKTLEE